MPGRLTLEIIGPKPESEAKSTESELVLGQIIKEVWNRGGGGKNLQRKIKRTA